MRGITIIKKGVSVHTGNDLNLVQEIKEINNPAVQSYIVEVPGRNGALNLTTALTGETCYHNRDLQFQYFGAGTRAELLAQQDALNKYHGELVQIIDDDTPGFYYEGECTVDHKFGPNYLQSIIKVDANPFRLSNDYKTINTTLSSTAKTVSITNSGLTVTPVIVVATNAKIVSGENTFNLTAGTFEIPEIVLHNGVNKFTVTGSGALTIKYKEARL